MFVFLRFNSVYGFCKNIHVNKAKNIFWFFVSGTASLSRSCMCVRAKSDFNSFIYFFYDCGVCIVVSRPWIVMFYIIVIYPLTIQSSLIYTDFLVATSGTETSTHTPHNQRHEGSTQASTGGVKQTLSQPGLGQTWRRQSTGHDLVISSP